MSTAKPPVGSPCLPCEMESCPERAIVFRDPLWACEVVPGFDVPGWFVLRVRRHALRIQSLNAAELASYGRRVHDLVGAITDVTGAPTTYVLTFSEANPHFHSLVAARGEDLPPEHRFGGILALREHGLDREAALELVPSVAAAYARRATEPAEVDA